MIVLLNPNVVMQKSDYFGSGIPYMPITLAYIAGELLARGTNFEVIDAFGDKPKQAWEEGDSIIQGLTVQQIRAKIPNNTEYVIICANTIHSHQRTLEIINEVKRQTPAKIIIIENTHLVVAYSTFLAKQDFFKAGADIVSWGEPEQTILDIINGKDLFKIDGISFKVNQAVHNNNPRKPRQCIDNLAPLWGRFPLQNYWSLGYAHAPIKGKYLPTLTSRGCPGTCNFCINPYVNNSCWRPKSPVEVVEEINHLAYYNISEVHISDLNPTADPERIKKICHIKIIHNPSLDDIKLKFATGTKFDILDHRAIRLLKKAGCEYLSFSPESGSEKVLELMNKKFNHKKALKLASLCHKLGIKTQACFVIGYPGETKHDLAITRQYAKKLAMVGVDEIALFIFAPMPGSKAYKEGKWNFTSLSQLTFSPEWSKTYKYLNKFRWKLYREFFMIRTIFHPLNMLRQAINLITGKYGTKIEMTIARIRKIRRWAKCQTQ